MKEANTGRWELPSAGWALDHVEVLGGEKAGMLLLDSAADIQG